MNQVFIPIEPSRRLSVWVWWALQVLGLSTALHLVAEIYADRIPSGVFHFIYLAISFTALTVILGPFLLRSLKQAAREPWLVLRAAGLAYLCCLLADRAVGFLGAKLLPDFRNLNDASILQMAQSSRILSRIGTVLLAPVAEELVHRGLIFGTFYERRPWMGYAISSFVFAGLHVVGYLGYYSFTEFLYAFLQYMPASLCLCWAYARSKNILSPILLHMVINQIATLSLR